MSENPLSGKTIAVLGGTGPQGRGLALRFAQAGLRVVLGSRTAERGEAAAAELGHGVTGGDNAQAADQGDIVLVVVPYDGHAELLQSLRDHLSGKVVVDCVNPLGFDKQGPFALLPEAGSATQEATQILTESTVVGAFHNVSAELLNDADVTDLATDVLVLGDDRDATDLIRALADTLPGGRGIYAGRTRNAHQIEALTANLIAINRRYKTHSSPRISGV